MARGAHKSLEAPLWQVQRRLHSCASMVEGPAAPDVFKAAAWITVASIDSNITECGSWGSSSTIHSGWICWAGGCFCSRASLTEDEDGQGQYGHRGEGHHLSLIQIEGREQPYTCR